MALPKVSFVRFPCSTAPVNHKKKPPLFSRDLVFFRNARPRLLHETGRLCTGPPRPYASSSVVEVVVEFSRGGRAPAPRGGMGRDFK